MPSCLHTLDVIALIIAASLSHIAVCGIPAEDMGLAMSTAWSSYSKGIDIHGMHVFSVEVYFTLTGFCEQTWYHKTGFPPSIASQIPHGGRECHTWTDFECESNATCENNQVYMYLNSTLVGCAFALVLLKLLFQLARCCCCKESRVIACVNVVLSAIAATLLLVATIVYGSFCKSPYLFGYRLYEKIFPGINLVELTNNNFLTPVDDDGFGPGFIAAVIAAVASVISTVFSLCMLKTNSSPEKESKCCSCV